MIRFKDIKWSEHWDAVPGYSEDEIRNLIPGNIQAAIMISLVAEEFLTALMRQPFIIPVDDNERS